jgi:chromosome partitioning protein
LKILTIANRKGGAGKSTCAAHLSIEAIKNGLKVILIDLDPQKTLEGWWNRREEEDLPLIDTDANTIESTLKKLTDKKFDLCIIDTPGDASQNSRVGIMVADLVLIPSKPTAPDLSAIGRTISMVEEHHKKFLFVLTQGIVRSKATFQASSALSGFGPVAPAVLDKLAEEEIKQVWGFLQERLFESKKAKKLKLNA